MKKVAIFIFVIMIFSISYGKVGKTGMTFLTLPTSASSAATMEVFEQNSNSPLSLFKNPTGLSEKNSRIAFTHNSWFADITAEILSFSFPSKYGTFGIGGNFLRVPGIEVRNKPTVDPLHEIESQYFSGNIGYKKKVFKNLDLGVGLKYLYESGYNEYAYGLAGDFAVNWYSPADLNISLRFDNVGGMKQLDNEATALANTFNVGVVRPEIFNQSPISASIGLNFESNIGSEESGGQIGTKIELYDMITVRGGFETFGNVQKQSFGFGIKYKKVKIDYSILFMDNQLGNPELISIEYLF